MSAADNKLIGEVARKHYGDYVKMYEAHGWKVDQPRLRMVRAARFVTETYGSVDEFVKHHERGEPPIVGKPAADR